MSVKTVETITCDLCKNDNKGAKASGWISVDIENTYSDRTFNRFDLCPSCVTEIIKKASIQDIMKVIGQQS